MRALEADKQKIMPLNPNYDTEHTKCCDHNIITLYCPNKKNWKQQAGYCKQTLWCFQGA